MSQSRKRKRKNSKDNTPSHAFNSNSNDVVDKIDGLRTNIRQEHKNMNISTSTNNIKIVAVMIIIIVGSAGFLILYNPGALPIVPHKSPAHTLNLIGNFKQDTSASPVFVGKKASFVYVGGQFCPFCAMQRWAIVMALSHFGNFSSLGNFTSAEDKVPTYDFSSASYSSAQVDFQSVELYNNQYPTYSAYESLTGLASTDYSNYGTGSIPFICIAGSIYRSGAGPSFNLNSFKGQSFSTIQTQVNSKSGALYYQIQVDSAILVQLINQVITAQSSTANTTTITNATS